MNELSYPIWICPIWSEVWSEVGRIKVFTCMLKVRTMSDTIRNSNFLLHVNVLTIGEVMKELQTTKSELLLYKAKADNLEKVLSGNAAL